MATYTVTPANIGNATKVIRESATTYRKLAGSFSTQVVELAAYWKGIDYDSFKAKMDVVIKDLENMAEKLEADANVLDAQAGNYSARVQNSIDTLPQ